MSLEAAAPTLWSPGHLLVLLLFVLAALVAAAGARVLSVARDRSKVSPERMHAVAETTAFFNVTPNEDAIRQKLAEAVAALTGAASVVTDRQGQLVFRSGARHEGVSARDHEVQHLVSALIRKGDGRSTMKGGLRARLITSSGERLGIVVWGRPTGDRTRGNPIDQHVELLTELAGAAIARVSRDDGVRKRRPSRRSGGVT